MTVQDKSSSQVAYTALTEHSIDMNIDGDINTQSALYYRTAMRNDTDNPQTTTKPVAHFFGGNGFAVGAYTPLLNALGKQFDMTSLAMRGSWKDKPAAKKRTREEDADLLIQFIEQTQTAPIIGIGHSQGATSTALACAKRPDLFSALYLIEPVTFTRKQVQLYKVLPRWLLKRNEPFKSTLVKQALWQSVDEYYNCLRKKHGFKRLSDDNLYIYAENSLEKTDAGLSLVFPPEQELANYFGIPFIDDALMTINQKKIPYHLLIGKPTIFVSDAVRQEWKKFVPTPNITTYTDYGHLLPVEAPELCAKKIIEIEKGEV